MTSILLIVIGILLAAAAALSVVYYGGDAFNAGNARASASTIVNMGSNVQHAAELYRVQEGGPPEDVEELVAKGYLAQRPDPGALGQAVSTWTDLSADGGTVRAYVIRGIDERVCREINRELSHGDTLADAAGLKSGCISTGDGRYYFIGI